MPDKPPIAKDTQHDGYLVPAPLVHKLIIAIFASLVGIGGYMAVWAVGDAAFKSEVMTTMKNQENHLRRMGDSLLNHLDGHPARVEDRVSGLEDRVNRLEDKRFNGGSK